MMKTVVFEVRSADEVMAQFVRAWETGIPEAEAHYSFVSPELMAEVLTEGRLHLLSTLCGAGPLSTKEIAQRIGQDVDAIQAELTALLKAGLIDRAKNGKVIFPFEAMKVESPLHAPESMALGGTP